MEMNIAMNAMMDIILMNKVNVKRSIEITVLLQITLVAVLAFLI